MNGFCLSCLPHEENVRAVAAAAHSTNIIVFIGGIMWYFGG